MNIDFNKAPAGYPIWVEDLNPDFGGDMSGWHRDDGDRYTDQRGEYWTKPDRGDYEVHHREETAKWSGEEYPPVGLFCEYQNNQSGVWGRCEIVAHRKGGWVVIGDDCETDFVTLEALRPIRTPEQIAEEKQIEEIGDLTNDILRLSRETNHPNSIGGSNALAKAMYEAGYRKQVQP